MRRALAWIKRHQAAEGGVRVHHRHAAASPEVTGYLIPTLWGLGERDLALHLARWELSMQRPDGSFAAIDGIPYTFDTAQVVRGLLTVLDAWPAVEGSLRRACDFIEQHIDAQGRVSTPSLEMWRLPGGEMFTEYTNLYVLTPLVAAGQRLGESRYLRAAERSLAFFTGQPDLVEFKPSVATLSHAFGYMLEALVDLGERHLAQQGLAQAAALQRSDGAIPAYPGATWVCSPGLAQLALTWYKVGEVTRAEKALAYLERMQTRSGGFYGSYGPGAQYFPREEISWAVKFFLDCYTLKGRSGEAPGA